MTIERIDAGPRMSQAVVYNNVVHLAGQVADDAAGRSVADQTRQILASIDALLAKAGTDKRRLLTATIYLVDMQTFAEMNSVWDTWVVPGATPTRATVCSPGLAGTEYKVEIVVTAAKP